MPKVILYCEYLRLWNGILFPRPDEMGFLTSYFNQMKALKAQDIDFTENLFEDCDIFQANTQGLRTVWLVKKFKKRGVKTIIYAHATAEELHGGFRVFHLFASLYRKYLSYVYNCADAVVCPSAYTARLLNERYGVPKEKTVFISNGVNVGKFVFDPEKRRRFRETHGIQENEIAVINVAMAIKKKGIDTFIALAREYPKIKFFWFGKIFHGLFAPSLPPRPENLTFYGYVADIVAAYSAADIFLFPSYEENQGISVLEAGAIGLPVLIRDIPVYYEWMKDGENCLKAKSDEEFKEKLGRLMNDGDLRKKLGQAAHETVLENHSLDAVGKKLKNLYADLMAGGHRVRHDDF